VRMDSDAGPEPEETFEVFFARAEARLRSALTSLYGADMGREATAEAMAWAYEHWDRLAGVEHQVAYLYRVGQSRTRRLRRRRVMFAAPAPSSIPEVDPRLAGALAALPERQRVAVTLVHGHDWSHADVAALMEISASTVATHVARAVASLRAALEEVPADDRH
jgi:DNA-directed RNA polymerase specialized sigma24 family protein